MPILTTEYNDLVKNSLITWRAGYASVPEVARSLYDIIPNPNLTSEYSQIDTYGFAKRKDEGGSFVKGNPKQGYTLNLTKSRIGLTDDITWDMRKYDRHLSPVLVIA